jgi:hypothetical protein
MRRRWRRRLSLGSAAVCVAGAVTVGALAWLAGWPATREALANIRLDTEAYVWPPLSRVASRFSPGASAEECAVWRTIAGLHSRMRDGRALQIAVNPTATWPEPESPASLRSRIVEGWGANDPGNPEAAVAVADFLGKNSRTTAIGCGALPPNTRCLARAALDKHRDEMDGWDRFTKENGVVGYLTMSRVGFDALHTHAVVYVGASCGPLCGSGGYFVMTREKGAWRVVAYHIRWVS